MGLRALLKEITPPVLLRTLRCGGSGAIRFTGDYRTWSEARKASGGYDDGDIVRRVRDAALKVKRHEAADERDAVAFAQIQYSFPVLAALCRAQARCRGKLKVLDFGGALGRNYRHYRSFLGEHPEVDWSVIELPALVSIGRSEFENDELRFFTSLRERPSAVQPDVILLCSVLQYIEDPYTLISDLLRLNARHIVVERTPCWDGERDVLTVQHVPEAIYRASYPCWIFSRSRVAAAFLPRYRQIAALREPSALWYGAPVRFELDGFIFDLER